MSKHAKRRANKKAKQEAAVKTQESPDEPQNDVQKLAAAMAGRNPFESNEDAGQRKSSAKRQNKSGSRKNSARGDNKQQPKQA